MRVAVVTTRHGAQDDRIYFKQALSLARRMSVTMIAPDDGVELEWASEVSYRPIPRRYGLLGRLWSLVEAVRAVRRACPDFCHVHDLELCLTLPLLRLVTRAKLIYDSHEVFTKEDLLGDQRIPKGLRPLVALLVSRLETFLLRFCDHIVPAVDPGRRYLGRVRTPVTPVFNYPPRALFETDSARLEAAREVYRGRLPIVYQGTISRDRGLFQMIEAVAIVKRAEPRVLLRLVGAREGELISAALCRAEELGVRSSIEVSSRVPEDEIGYVMKSSLIGLVPLLPTAKHELALPIKLLEYMACGLPVVAGDLALVRRYVQESGTGLLYDATRPEEMARCVLELLSNPARCREMGENGRRAVRELWNWDKMEEALFDVYQSLGARFQQDHE